MVASDRFADVRRRLAADRPALIGLIFLIVVGLISLGGLPFAFADAQGVNLGARNLAPFQLEEGFAFILGGDPLGRSVLLRLVLAGATTLGVALSAAVTALVIGGAIGIVAGYFGGFVDSLAMRAADVMLSFPTLLLAVTLIYVFQPSLFIIVGVLAGTRVPAYMRVARAETLEIRSRLFVEGARSLGCGPWRILTRHITPVVAPTILTLTAVDLAYVILLESSLSFLGLGVQHPNISWGLMVAEGRDYLLQAPWLTIFPGLMITLTTISLNLLAAWLRLVSDPKHHWRLDIRRVGKGKAASGAEES